MKILHFADVHFGSDMTGPVDPESGLPQRLRDFLRSMDTISETVETEDIDLVVFAGDAFKDRNPNPTLEREFAKRIRRMALSAPVVLVVGNHDLPGAFGKAHTLEIYRALEIDQVYVVDRPRLLNILTEAGEVQVVGIPWPMRHNVMTKEALQGVPAEEIDRLIAETVAGKISELASQLDPDLPSIMAAHLTVEGGDMGGGTPVGLGGGVTLPLEALALPQFEYVALGHLHRYQMLHEGPPVVYSGSIERIDFGEEREEKGFVVVTLGEQEEDLFGEGASAKVEFRPLPVRGFVTIEVPVNGANPTAAVLNAIAEKDVTDKVVRVIINASAEGAALLDEGEIHKALGPALRVASITKNVEREARMRLEGGNYEEMAPLELLTAYFESKGTDDEEQERLIKAAEGLMTEGERCLS